MNPFVHPGERPSASNENEFRRYVYDGLPVSSRDIYVRRFPGGATLHIAGSITGGISASGDLIGHAHSAINDGGFARDGMMGSD